MPSAKHIEQAIALAAMVLGHDACSKGYGKSSVKGKGGDLKGDLRRPCQRRMRSILSIDMEQLILILFQTQQTLIR